MRKICGRTLIAAFVVAGTILVSALLPAHATDKIHVAHIEASYDFVRHFPQARRIYSCSIGVSKPNPLIYREALRACKVKAGEAVYIDDIAANVDAARQLGLAGIQFQSPTQLLQDLGALGVEIPISVTK